MGAGARFNPLPGPVRTRLSKDCGSPRRAPEGRSAFSLPGGRNRPLINILLSLDRWASDFGTLVLPGMIDL